MIAPFAAFFLATELPNFPLAIPPPPPYTALSTIPGHRESLVYFCSTGPKVTRHGAFW